MSSDPDYPVMHLCIQCMKRPAAPHNGGLCSVCAPPLKPGKLLRAMRKRRARFYAEIRARRELQLQQHGQEHGQEHGHLLVHEQETTGR